VLHKLTERETDASAGTRSRLIDRFAVGKHTFRSVVTRRQTANRLPGAFTATTASRPGQQVQIDSTPIDVMVLAAEGVPVKADLTIVVDVTTRTICAAVLLPVSDRISVDGDEHLVDGLSRAGRLVRAGAAGRAAATPQRCQEVSLCAASAADGAAGLPVRRVSGPEARLIAVFLSTIGPRNAQRTLEMCAG
jgi:hypothetical protein